MTTEQEGNRPNEYGFAGGATAPEPRRDRESGVEGESVAVPAGDITGAVTGAIDEITEPDDEESSR